MVDHASLDTAVDRGTAVYVGSLHRTAHQHMESHKARKLVSSSTHQQSCLGQALPRAFVAMLQMQQLPPQQLAGAEAFGIFHRVVAAQLAEV